MERLTRLTELVKGTGCYRYGVDGKYVSSFSLGYEDSPSVLRGEVVDRLAAYEDAEEQGLLLRLPCPIGTTVYIITAVVSRGYPDPVIENVIREEKFSYEHIGISPRYLFLSYEEAEAALKKRKGKYEI